ncbi:hypothetical protein KPL71_007022 [Citrus sinensis]|uniref:Uncharacterized protein n=1 Tax=Citrus sinensis TaxID=2711 RepID=A0ACB8LVW2_CITSI|nr:hypothetical protein KPL71_007022 [Citrus sinensis]
MSGPLVCENVIGVVHDHFITLHLDMDIDGANNSFVEVHLEKQETSPGESPRKGYLKIEQYTATPSDRNEQWAGGLLVYQSREDEALAVWSEMCNKTENLKLRKSNSPSAC